MKPFRVAIIICMVVAVLQAFPGDARAIDVTYPAGIKKIDSDFQSDFGMDGGARRNEHQGIDIGGRSGQPILAVADGTVLEATAEGCWGPTVAVDHGNDANGNKVVALYGHVGEMLVSEGDQIKRADVIARLGEIRGTYECVGANLHLHFQLGRLYRDKNSKSSYWGSNYFLEDGRTGVNPHLYWADGPGKVTCFELNRIYPPGSLTYPFPCAT